MFKSPRREFSVFCTLFYGNKFIILRSQANLLQAVKLNVWVFAMQPLEQMSLGSQLHALRNAHRNQVFHFDGIDTGAFDCDNII